MEPEVHVRSVRRRRSGGTVQPTPPPLNLRNAVIYLGLAVLILALMVEGFLRDRPHQMPLPERAHATEVRSALSEVAESLQVVVSWDLTLAEPAGRPDSIRIKVVPEQQQRTFIAVQSSNQLADTLYIPAPAPGQTLTGVSCATADHSEVPSEESCTPWQYIRPAATAVAATDPAAINQIVIKPSGIQVDPDIDGKCLQWQRAHPDRSVWIAVNRTAVPDCTGPNRKPTVAQFCAFAVLPDGRRVKTLNSSNNSYCEELFVEWSRESYS
ncbi:MAG TPA: hypothetical protein VD930_09645 [Gemmatimonadales bacterium]|nr:hypothetical protein [Gemmatimonadales bacterium]